MAQKASKELFKDLLRELFQLNNTDLDFGIYRIMNIKAQEVEHFINKDIDTQIESVKDRILERQSGDVKAELEESKAKLEKDFKVDFHKDGDLEAKVGQFGQLELFMEPFNRFKTAKEKLDNLRISEDTEKSIYNELYRFFERYYEGGDFISKPRAGKNNYIIPYEGEEVKLYWANYDQYYIKTGDNFKNYLFNNQATDPIIFTQVEFRILDADTAINNNKEEKGRLFIPTEEPFEWIAEERKLLVKFNYRVPTTEEKKIWGDKQSVKTENKGINQKLAALVADAGKKTSDAELLLFLSKTRTNSKGESIPLFVYHLEKYTTVNKFDYFIHKDLKGFLQRELDTFLKNDVFSIAFLDPVWKEQEVQEAIKNNVLKASAIRDIALVVIDFVSEIEEFQKRLFEKKKFVVESHYCMTLDRIPESVYDEVAQYILADKDQKQIQNWIDLKFITGIELKPKQTKGKEDDEYADAIAFLKANDKLVLDTKYLTDEIKWKLLSSIENLEEITNGLLINSENYHALNILQSKYKGKIKTTYIDPPYNTGGNDFSYKDSFMHSSWLSMMNDRIELAKKLNTQDGVIFVSNDDNENARLKSLLDKIYGSQNFIENLIWRKKSGGGQQDDFTVREHEYITFYSKNKSKFEIIQRQIQKGQAGYSYLDDEKQKHYKITKLAKWGSGAHKEDRPTMYDYPELLSPDGEQAFPVAPDGRPGRWRVGRVSAKSLIDNNLIHWENVKGEWIPYEKEYQPTEEDLKEIKERSIFYDIVENTGGTNELKDMWGYKDSFPNPKPSDLLFYVNQMSLGTDEIGLDFFGGSGTNVHSIIRLNRYDGGYRKYIAVEMGKYFDTTTLPRIKKVVFSDRWSNGKPIKSDEQTEPHIFQYIKLEQYEDSLNNIEIHTTAPQLSFLDNIRYQLIHGTKGSDSLINLEKFTKPFDYTMKIVQHNEIKDDTNIDLLTTFNFLLGIEVQRYILAENNGLVYKVVIGKKGLQQHIIIWRNFDETTIDLKVEREFITKQDWYNTTAFVFCNGDNAFSAHPIEPEFFRLMNEPVL